MFTKIQTNNLKMNTKNYGEEYFRKLITYQQNPTTHKQNNHQFIHSLR